MIYPVYAIRDFKTGFLQPVCEVNEASAVRNFSSAVLSNDKGLFFTNPGDYALYHIGSYDTDSGVIDSLVPVTEVVTASQIVATAMRQRQEVKDDG